MKKLIGVFAIIIGFAVFVAFPGETSPQFGADSLQYLQYFDSNGPREAGTPAEKKAADYIFSQLTAMGYMPERQAFREIAENKGIKIEVSSENIICVKNGLSNKEIIVAAHYDSHIEGNGSDDNASGVALLLEMCKNIKEITVPFTIRFIFFGSEEVGEAGSIYYTKKMTTKEIQNTIAMLNFDSLIAGDKLYAHGDYGDKGQVRDWMLKKAEFLGIPLVVQSGKNKDYPAGTTGDWGDQEPFHKAGIQYAAFEATNWEIGELDGYTQTDMKFGESGKVWHTSYDNLSYIEKTFPDRIKDHMNSYARLLYSFLTEYK